jgi:hypothetical protein
MFPLMVVLAIDGQEQRGTRKKLRQASLKRPASKKLLWRSNEKEKTAREC